MAAGIIDSVDLTSVPSFERWSFVFAKLRYHFASGPQTMTLPWESKRPLNLTPPSLKTVIVSCSKYATGRLVPSMKFVTNPALILYAFWGIFQ